MRSTFKYIGFIVIFLPRICFGQSINKLKDVILTGTVSPNMIAQSDSGITRIIVEISKYPFTHESIQRAPNQLYQTDVKANQEIHLTIHSPSKRFYMYIYIQRNWGNKLADYWSGIDNVYILDAGDHITARFDNNYTKFFGRGSEKLNCESELYSHTYVWPRTTNDVLLKLIDLKNQNKLQEAQSLMNYKKDSCLIIQKKIVERYRSALGNALADIMLENCIGLRYFWEFRGYDQSFADNYKESQEAINQDSYRKVKFDFRYQLNAKINSPVYVDALYQKIKFESRLDADGKFEASEFYTRIFNRITKNYVGVVRDKLMALFVVNSLPFYDVSPFFDKAIKLCGVNDFRELIIKEKNIRSKSKAFFSFALPDTNGKITTLQSLSHKVIIMDFWFTGCENCLTLHEKMKPIRNKYRGDPNIAFLTINVDKSKAMWLRSIQSGKYVDVGDINLNTGGKGIDNPLLKFYAISGFPTMFIISNGKMINSSPTRPLTEKSAAKLIAEIENARKLR